jgi:hypothetical protein
MLTAELLLSIRRRARIPTASALGSQDSDLLAVANEEVDAYLFPLVRSVREDHGLAFEDQEFIADLAVKYRIPYRASGNTVREVSYLDAQGYVSDPSRISVDALENQRAGFYVEGDKIALTDPVGSGPVAIRFWFHMRPSRLVEVTRVATVSVLDSVAGTVTLSSVPAAFAGQSRFDLVRRRSPFAMLAWDWVGTLVGSVITFADGIPGDLELGDYVCLPEEAPMAQVPVELHPLLAQRVAVKWLEVNDPQGYEAAVQEMTRMEKATLDVITPRVDGAPQAITVMNALWTG